MRRGWSKPGLAALAVGCLLAACSRTPSDGNAQTPVATATSAMTLAQATTELGCVSCHEADFRKIGPSFKEVAAKYGDTDGAEEHIAGRIRAGGSGSWGETIMPPQPQVNEAKAHELAKMILALR